MSILDYIYSFFGSSSKSFNSESESDNFKYLSRKSQKNNEERKNFFILVEYGMSLEIFQKQISENKDLILFSLLEDLDKCTIGTDQSQLGLKSRQFGQNSSTVRFLVFEFSASNENTLKKNIENKDFSGLQNIFAYKTERHIQKPIDVYTKEKENRCKP